MKQLSLFSFFNTNEPQTFEIPDGDLILYPAFFTTEEADQFLKILKQETLWQQNNIKIYGKEVPLPRLTAWYGNPGYSYTYSGIAMNPHPWNSTLLAIKQRVERLAQVSFNSVLLNLYRTGSDSVSWHSDDEPELAPQQTIASVSFGETRRFEMKHKTKTEVAKLELKLTHGSVLLMRGETQQHWSHQVPKTKKKVDPRINLTFRVIC
jgi:alkylated DNA repair dioxygenase AlkB